MVLRYLLDTNICIYIRRRRPATLLARFQALSSGEAAISIVTHGELMYGAQKSPNQERAFGDLQELEMMIPVLPLPVAASAIYGRVRADLERRGEMIGGNDLWIAAHALAAGLIMVTSNEREFRRVAGLAMENWAG